MKRLATALALLSLLAVAVLALARDDDEPPAGKAPRKEPAAHTRACDAGSSVPAQPTTDRDATLGSAKLVGFRGLFENAKAEDVLSPRPGVEALKAALVFPGSRDLTIAVPASLRRVLALDYAPERRGVDTPAEAHASVRFHACPAPGRATGYPGGLIYSGPWPACVALDVSVEGRPPQRHPLSFGAGRCKQPG